MKLNQEQYEAVFSTAGPVVVCAGAGSGKTRVITYRVLHLLHQGVQPTEITCVTFTNKAAREMKERIDQMLSEYPVKPVVTTFHGYALRLLKQYGKEIGLGNFTVIGDEEQELLLKTIISTMEIKDKACTPKKILGAISFIKNNYFLHSEYQGEIEKDLFYLLYEKYEQEKKKNNVFDFDDLLLLAIKLLQNKTILEDIRRKTKHVMIDEYQDTNSIQHMMVKSLCLNNQKDLMVDSLFVVGDEDQSIYSWRGANVANIVYFQKDFPGTKFLKLTQNYRSTKKILSLANQIIEKNSLRKTKLLWTETESNVPAYLLELQSGYQESEVIIDTIKKLKKNNNLGSCAILYRSHYQSRLFEEACVKNNLPYSVYGGINFYQRQEIKDILSYVILATNEYDKTAFIRCCNTPQRGFGSVALEKFLDFWAMSEEGILSVIKNYCTTETTPTRQEIALKEISQIIETTQKSHSNPADAIQYIITATQYLTYIEKIAENDLEVQTRKENLKELLSAAKTFHDEEGGTIHDFIMHLSVLYEKEIEDSEEEKTEIPILLMSIHAAKGLEFDTVFVVGLEDGIFPSSRGQLNTETIEEERRLLYVALTRAGKRLFCSYALSRAQWGKIQTQKPSLFIADFGQEHTVFLTFKEHSPYTISAIASDSELHFSPSYAKPRTFTPPQPTTQPSISPEKKPFGQKIFHTHFGEGIILEKNNQYLTIQFKNYGKKIIHEDYIIKKQV
jgi:DNA helicase-2/ATP-dependent DNA helicase PcrA